MERNAKIRTKGDVGREKSVGPRTDNTDIRIASRDTRNSRPLLIFPFPILLFLSVSLELLTEAERSAAATTAAETSTLLGCRSCGTGLRELPLEELHSPYVLPRLHVTHIYLRLLHGLSHTHMEMHD